MVFPEGVVSSLSWKYVCRGWPWRALLHALYSRQKHLDLPGGGKGQSQPQPRPTAPCSRLGWTSNVPGLEDSAVGHPGGQSWRLWFRAEVQGVPGTKRTLPGPPSWGPGVPLWHEYRSGSTLAPVQDPVSWSPHPIIFILRTQGRCPAHTTASAPGPSKHL